MEIGEWESSKGLNELYREIRRLDLESHVAELDNFGYTIVPPEKVAPPEFIDRLLTRILELVEKRSGVKPDLETGSTKQIVDRHVTVEAAGNVLAATAFLHGISAEELCGDELAHIDAEYEVLLGVRARKLPA